MLQVEVVPIESLVEYENNAKLHPHEQIDQIANSIAEFGNNDPIAVWENDSGELEIVEGHGRLVALKKLGIHETPIIKLNHLSDEQRRAYALIHNQLTMNSSFDIAMLLEEIGKIETVSMDDYGFAVDVGALNIDGLLDDDTQVAHEKKDKCVTVICECCGEEFDVEL